MALFDFLRRRPRPSAGSGGGITGFLSRIFGRRKREPEPEQVPIEPEIVPDPADLYYDEPEPIPEADIIIDDNYVETQVTPPPVFTDPEAERLDNYLAEHTEINPYSDQELLDRYGKMIDTMVRKGYIKEFDNEADAAEFLRVLSSQAWEEAHGYWYSIEALSQIQSAIAHGAMAGTLQSNYNAQIEKKSNNYLKTWEDWLQAGY